MFNGSMKLLPCFTAFLATSLSVSGLSIRVDYSYDTTGFFDSTPAARTAVEKAASDLGAAIISVPGAITTDIYSGSNGGSTVAFDWRLSFSNPAGSGSITLQTFTMEEGVITVFVGMEALSNSTLGMGGPSGAGVSASASGSTAAVPIAEANSDAAMTRGTGPVIGEIMGNFGNGTEFNLLYGSIVGSLSFDYDTNNNGQSDSAAELANFWHYDPFSAVAAGKNDLYSVALHEMLHAIGIGTSDTWDSLVSGTTWLGENAQALNAGTGANLLDADGSHLRSGFMSPRLSDGVLQEVVMDPTVTVGQRKLLTAMDLAFLRDIGYETIPEPGAAMLLISGAGWLAMARRRGSGANTR
jgi:hypothetical protein